MSAPPLPDFFVVGAPKAGTTAFEGYLGSQEGVCFAREKDTGFFCPELVGRGGSPPDLEAYRQLFDGCRGARRVGESSVFYLYSSTAPHRIRDTCGDVDIFILVRDPVELIHSYHSQMVFVGGQSIGDFEEALEAGEAGPDADAEVGRGPSPKLLRYSWIGRLSPHIRRYQEVFGPERVHLVRFHDIVHRPGEVTAEALRSLDLPPTAREDVASLAEDATVRNPNKVVRWRRLRDLVASPPPSLRRLARFLLPTTGLRRALSDRLLRLNTSIQERDPMPPALRARLEGEFQEEVRELERLLGRPLSPSGG